MSNPIPHNIFERLKEILERGADFSVTLLGGGGKITEATWSERQEASKSDQ